MPRKSSLLLDDIEHFHAKIVLNEVETSDDHEVISILYQVTTSHAIVATHISTLNTKNLNTRSYIQDFYQISLFYRSFRRVCGCNITQMH